MKIRDFLKIKQQKTLTVSPEDSLKAATEKLVENNIGALPVCDEEGMLLGIISERDLLRQTLNAVSPENTKVQDVMVRDVAVAGPEDELEYAARVMKTKRIRHLPVVTGNRLEAILSLRDIIEEQLKETEAEIRYAGLIRRSHLGRPQIP